MINARDVLWGLAGAAVVYVVVQRRRQAIDLILGRETTAAVHDDDDGEDDGPESDGKPCCAACASSSSLWAGGCGGTSPHAILIGEQVGNGGGKVPVVSPWILTAPAPSTQPKPYYKPGTGIMSPGRSPAVKLLSRTGATVRA